VRDKLGQYKILFVPFPVMISKNVTEGLTRFIQNGGTVVAEARLAWNDERGFSSDEVPGMGLAKVFGAREKVIRPRDKPEIVLDSNATLSGWPAGTRVSAAAFEEDLEPLPGARVLAHFADGAPAIVENTYGKGKTILVGSFLAMSYQREHQQSAKELLLAFAHAAGVKPEVTISGENTSQMEVRRLVGNGLELLFAFNHADHPADAKISVDVPWTVGDVRSINEDQAVAFSQSSGQLILTKKLPAGAVWVVRYSQK